MGSGSSKSKVRAIKICSQQLPEAPVVPIGGRTTVVTCEQKKVDNNKEISAERNSTALSEQHRSILVDPDLELIEDILAESEDCFFWPASAPARQTVTSSQQWKTNHESLQQTQNVDNLNLQTINKPASENKELQHKHHKAPEQKVLDIENNNLPKFSSTLLAPTETSTTLMYDDVEEELMDSIEKEYSHIHHTSSVWET